MSYTPSDAFNDAIESHAAELNVAIREHLLQAGVDRKRIEEFLEDIDVAVRNVAEYLDETATPDTTTDELNAWYRKAAR